MHVVKGIFASGSDVDHGVEGGEKELGCVGAALRVDGRKGAGGDGTGPYLVEKTLGVADGLDGLWGVGEIFEAVLADIDVLAEGLTEWGLGVVWKEIETMVGDVDGVGLFDDEMAVIVVTGHGSGEGEGEEQSEEGEDGAFDGGVGLFMGAATEETSDFDEDEHDHEEREGGEGREGHG